MPSRCSAVQRGGARYVPCTWPDRLKFAAWRCWRTCRCRPVLTRPARYATGLSVSHDIVVGSTSKYSDFRWKVLRHWRRGPIDVDIAVMWILVLSSSILARSARDRHRRPVFCSRLTTGSSISEVSSSGLCGQFGAGDVVSRLAGLRHSHEIEFFDVIIGRRCAPPSAPLIAGPCASLRAPRNCPAPAPAASMTISGVRKRLRRPCGVHDRYGASAAS